MRARPTARLGPDGDQVDTLFRAYRDERTEDLRGRLTTLFMPLVHQVARRYARAGIPLEDLYQIGYIGLMHAVTNFDPDRNVKFETYARHLIAGEIRHYLRDQGTTVRRPRWLYEMDHQVSRTAVGLTQRLGRPPVPSEIAAAAGIREDQVDEVLRARESLRFVSLDEEREGEDGVPMSQRDRITDAHMAVPPMPVEDRIYLADAVERLSGLQRKVIYALFYLDLTQTEAARKLGISQKHVSRLMHAALRRLRTSLQPDATMRPRAAR
ncbi:MAG: sigma-70 family RNA polymerase sigma factor [bacterium]